MKIILNGGHGFFEPNAAFEHLIKQKGYKNWAEFGARTDEDIIGFVEKNKNPDYPQISMVGKEDYAYLTVREVDTSTPWTIREYDNAESIHYIRFEVIDEQTNFCRYI